MAAARRTCPVIIGPTGVGKTNLITGLVDAGDLEIISLDSRQIYRDLQIGTAQPTTAERALCPHHLIDFLPPSEKYDGVRFRADFERIYTEITGRGHQPVLVGGAAMYLKILREGVMEVPGQTPARLRAVRAELAEVSDDEIRTRLAMSDPESWQRLHANDRYRNQRALEILLIAGESMSNLIARQHLQPALGLDFQVHVLARPVTELDQRIARRTDEMLALGWVAETERALSHYSAQTPGLRSIGYREIVRFLRGDISQPDLAPAIVLATRQYAKRQRTWLRKLPSHGTWHPDDQRAIDSISAACRTHG